MGLVRHSPSIRSSCDVDRLFRGRQRDLSIRAHRAADHECNYIACWPLIAMTWEGYVNVPTEGDYTINN